VESLENQTQVFHSFPRPLKIWQRPPDSHIPTAPAWAARKRGKPQTGFPLSQPAQATTISVLFSTPTQNHNERKSAAARPPHPDPFQDHLVLETLPRFRIILGLENAELIRVAVREVVS
jgi:hypothetical protein